MQLGWALSAVEKDRSRRPRPRRWPQRPRTGPRRQAGQPSSGPTRQEGGAAPARVPANRFCLMNLVFHACEIRLVEVHDFKFLNRMGPRALKRRNGLAEGLLMEHLCHGNSPLDRRDADWSSSMSVSSSASRFVAEHQSRHLRPPSGQGARVRTHAAQQNLRSLRDKCRLQPLLACVSTTLWPTP